MSKPKSMPAPGSHPGSGQKERQAGHSGGQEPLSGSKKVKQANHVDHHNRQG
ncbi:small acid-soluble spore protein P [Paenibacillus glufosinatiresistens]|uniref:small acid-soluble spore protein P n=1 Tax=Paenibacillus glufosinatiresistens TaxID=3070657 RepID=UPI00286E67ED|nr:small acid-soluble spore protein P [Paenibacillus sp. YX.27]